ncbi:MAG: 5'-nucleotidase, lipoprotein e(P4) family [Ginsengibacter sp.]
MKKITFALLVTIISCTTSHLPSPVQVSQSSNLITDGKLYTAVFQQRAAEYRALCFQAFNIARLRLDEALQNKTGRPMAVITDIDETILDNSPYAVHQALQGKDYDQSVWNNWSDLSKADTVPGSATFLKYAASHGVEVYYITNRGENEKMNTLLNLQKFNLPDADSLHIFLKQTTSSKESRRQMVMDNHDVVLLLGDNLGDFSSLFDKKTEDIRLQNANTSYVEFGKRFIVLPNPGYGDWESSMFSYNYYTPAQKDSVIRKLLKNFR